MRFGAARLGNIADASDRVRKTPPHFSLSRPTITVMSLHSVNGVLVSNRRTPQTGKPSGFR